MANHLAKVPFLFSDEKDSYSVSGIWKKGKLNGSVTTTASDGSYTSCHYSDDKPMAVFLNTVQMIN